MWRTVLRWTSIEFLEKLSKTIGPKAVPGTNVDNLCKQMARQAKDSECLGDRPNGLLPFVEPQWKNVPQVAMRIGVVVRVEEDGCETFTPISEKQASSYLRNLAHGANKHWGKT